MENISWDTSTFLSPDELESYFEGYYDSSSPDGLQGSSPNSSKNNIVSERKRRHKLNEKLYALRAVVPNITKLDKASIIKDAIEYIKSLQDEENKIKLEMWELELKRVSSNNEIFKLDEEDQSMAFSSSIMKKARMDSTYHPFSMPSSSTSSIPPSHPIELLELSVSSMEERIIVVSLACSKRSDTMVKLCEIFESLNLKIITANITASSRRLLKTLFIEGNEEEIEGLSFKIKAAISAINGPYSPMSI